MPAEPGRSAVTIQAIETYYAGHLFRSRLEARWAVVFDSLGLRWEYEPQGYLVGEDRRPYLPDFYLTDLGWWVEVKGASDRLNVSLLTDAVHPDHGLGRTDPFYKTNLLILGDIPREDGPHAHFTISRSAALGRGPMHCDNGCPVTSPQFGLHHFNPIPDTVPTTVLDKLRVTVSQYERLRRQGAILTPACRTSSEQPQDDLTQAIPLARHIALPRVEAAYTLGRTARFEHGQTP
jgi:hypothetical protein